MAGNPGEVSGTADSDSENDPKDKEAPFGDDIVINYQAAGAMDDPDEGHKAAEGSAEEEAMLRKLRDNEECLVDKAVNVDIPGGNTTYQEPMEEKSVESSVESGENVQRSLIPTLSEEPAPITKIPGRPRPPNRTDEYDGVSPDQFPGYLTALVNVVCPGFFISGSIGSVPAGKIEARLKVLRDDNGYCFYREMKQLNQRRRIRKAEPATRLSDVKTYNDLEFLLSVTSGNIVHDAAIYCPSVIDRHREKNSSEHLRTFW